MPATAAPSLLVRLGLAAGKAAKSRLRRLGLLEQRVNWAARAEICERCPMRVVQCGRSYCGKPFLQLADRDEAVDGCGCPTIAKAKDPAEHCPVDLRFNRAESADGRCTCRWCAAESAKSFAAAAVAR